MAVRAPRATSKTKKAEADPVIESAQAATVEHAVPGLEAPAEIVVDTWGIPHVRANTRRDIFFVQGFNAARDRLWQLDIWRKRGLGRLAADFGPGFLAQDRAARLFLYRGDMDAEWAAYGTPEARAMTEAFAAGINAYIELSDRDHSMRPPEFAAMGTRPGWSRNGSRWSRRGSTSPPSRPTFWTCSSSAPPHWTCRRPA